MLVVPIWTFDEKKIMAISLMKADLDIDVLMCSAHITCLCNNLQSCTST
jgi:hypothetical protein